jgi:hypothetical protein
VFNRLRKEVLIQEDREFEKNALETILTEESELDLDDLILGDEEIGDDEEYDDSLLDGISDDELAGDDDELPEGEDDEEISIDELMAEDADLLL